MHVQWRREKWEPEDLPAGIAKDQPQKARITQYEFLDKSQDAEKDEWGGDVKPRRVKPKEKWRGTT